MKRIIFFMILCCIYQNLNAQMVGPDIFLQGTRVEVGQSLNGSYGAGPTPGGYVAAGRRAMIWDNGNDGWGAGAPAFYGDYTVPGVPFEGWSIEVNGIRSDAFGTNALGTGFDNSTGGTLTGANCGYVSSGGTSYAIWQGSAGPGNALSIRQTSAITGGSNWVVVTAIFTNTGATPLNNIFYERTCDPDNQQAFTGNFATNNTITFQNPTGGQVLVSSTGTTVGATYLGLGTSDNRAKATIYQMWPAPNIAGVTTLANMFAETVPGAGGPYFYAAGATTFNQDIAIGLLFNLGTLNPGQSTCITYAYIFDGPGSLTPSIAIPAITAGTISGPTSPCKGQSGTFSNLPCITGGVWSSSNTAIANIDPITGVVTSFGPSVGSVTISYTITTSCGTAVATYPITVNETPTISPITPMVMCVGDIMPISFSGYSTPGGTWLEFSSHLDINTSTYGYGNVYGVSAGVGAVTYTVSNACGTATAVGLVTVNALPTATVVETSGRHCEGDVLTFCVFGPPNATFTYDGSPTDGVAWPWPGMSYYGTTDAAGVFCFTVTAVAPATSFHLVFITDPITGCTNFIDQTVTVCVAPHPTAGPITGPDVICQTETEGYTTLFSGVPGGMWSLSNANGTLVLPTSSSTGVLGVTTGTVTLSFSVTNCCASALATKDITIKLMPSAHAVYTGCMPPCPGTPITWLITGTPGATVTYGWHEPGGGSGTATVLLDGTGHASVSVPPAGTVGMYIFDIISVSFDGCVMDDGISMPPLMIEWPEACFDTSPKIPCEGGTVTLHVHGTPGATFTISPLGFTYTLDAMGNATITTTLMTTTTFTIGMVTGPCCSHYSGCTMTLTPIPYPVMTLTSNSPVCEGDAIILTGTCTPPSPFYDWTFPGLPGVSTLTPNYTITPATMADGGIYYLTGHNGPCSTTVTTNVIVKPIPPMPTAVYTGCRPPCPGTPLTFTIHGLPGATVNYGWVDPVSGMHSASIILDAMGNGFVTLTSAGTGMFIFLLNSITFDGCTNNDGIGIQPLDIEWPTACFDQSPQVPCDGGCVYLHLSGTPGATGFIEPGHIPFTLSALGTWASGCIIIHGPTTYTIGTVTGACCSRESNCSITVTPIPLPVISLAPSTVCEGTSLIMTVTCTPASTHYDWLIPGLAGFSTITNTYTVSTWATSANNGVYTVTGWNEGCSATATVTVNVLPLPTASMWCEVLCAQGDGATVILHFTGTPGSTVIYSTMMGGAPSSVVLDAFGNATVSTFISTTTTWAILDVISPDGCHSMISFPGCTATPEEVTPPTVTCWAYQDTFYPFAWHLGFTSSAAVTVDFTAAIFDPASSISCAGLPSLPTPFPIPAGTTEIFACDLDFTSCTGASCSTAYLISLFATNFHYGDCTYGLDCTAGADRPGHNDGNITKTDKDAGSMMLSVVPNPNSGAFTLQGDLSAKNSVNDVQLEIVDMLGKIIYSDRLAVDNGRINKQIVMGDSVPNGVYLIRLKNDEVNEVIRVTLTR